MKPVKPKKKKIIKGGSYPSSAVAYALTMKK